MPVAIDIEVLQTRARRSDRAPVLSMKTASAVTRNLAAALLALLLALRLLSPAGFMPSFDHGSLTIIACPDAGFAAAPVHPPVHHHHGKAQHLQQQCPYAATSGLGALAADSGGLVGVILVAIALLLGPPRRSAEHYAARVRPPSRAPPLPA